MISRYCLQSQFFIFIYITMHKFNLIKITLYIGHWVNPVYVKMEIVLEVKVEIIHLCDPLAPPF